MTITSRFNGICKSCGIAFPAGTPISWKRGYPVTHVNAAACHAAKLAAAAAPPAPPPPPPPVLSGAGAIVAFLEAAHAKGLKYPKARFMANGKEIALSRAGSGSKYPGATQVVLAGTWFGRINTDGTVAGPLAKDSASLAALAIIAADPAAAATAYGALTGRCTFCHLELTDEGSVEVGYGPVCAKNYGLPHTPKGTPDAIGQLSTAAA